MESNYVWKGVFAGYFLRVGPAFYGVCDAVEPMLMADLSYLYIEINGVFGESGGEDSTGLGFEASYDFADVFYVTAGLRQTM